LELYIMDNHGKKKALLHKLLQNHMKGQIPSFSWQAETKIDKITSLRKRGRGWRRRVRGWRGQGGTTRDGGGTD
jgi:hypothetical protein